MRQIGLLGLIILLNTSFAWANSVEITVLALFTDKALILINNKQRLLKLGITSPEGITLLSADSHSVKLAMDGLTKTYQLGTKIRANFPPPPAQAAVNIWPINGLYTTAGSVNGYSVKFLVDTGASAIVFNAATAIRLDLDFSKAPTGRVKTASGIVMAYQLVLDKVQIGPIELYNINALVMEGEQPDIALLGMSFLSQVEIQRKNERMQLRKKF